MISAIDTNILLDILIPDKRYAESSKNLVEKFKEKGKLQICGIVYSELASQFPLSEELELFLQDTGINLQHSNRESLSIAGERWKKYAAGRSQLLQCGVCGRKLSIECPQCGNIISCRQHIISDFIIGANALAHADLLLSRDRGYYKTYFKDLVVKDK
jgi:predicted nucleic acid-binding protein